jgi:hypothetical protein
MPVAASTAGGRADSRPPTAKPKAKIARTQLARNSDFMVFLLGIKAKTLRAGAAIGEKG